MPPTAFLKGRLRAFSGNKLIAWMLPAGLMAGIFFVSSLPGRDVPRLFCFQDVVFHAIIYAALAVLFSRALKISGYGMNRQARICLAVFFCLLYGISDEFHQSFVPGRDSSMFDVMVDVAGAVAGSIFYK